MDIETQTSKELKPARKISLELAQKVDMVCRKHNLKYTLLGDALWGAAEFSGFTPWSGSISIGLLYADYLKLLNICETEFENSDYYILNSNNSEQFEEFYSRIQKKSKVKLPDKRKDDQKYYDYFIDIIPIFFAGDTEKEHKEFLKNTRFYMKCLRANKIVPDTVKLSNLFKMVERGYYYSRRTDDTFTKLEAYFKMHNTPTKHVFIPVDNVNMRGIACLAETYYDLKEVSFEGHKFMSVSDAEKWLTDAHREKEMEKQRKKIINQSLLEGPEIMRRVQLIELDMLIELDRICRKHNIKYGLAMGTLLGAVRHKGFIPWDDDVDVFMLYEDYLRFIEIAPKEMDCEKYFLKTQETDEDCNLTFIQIKRNNTIFMREGRFEYNTHKGVFIDIFPLFNGSKSKIIHKLQGRLCMFFKTMTWAHLGAQSERDIIKKFYYRQLSRVSNKKSYEIFMKIATIVKNKSNNLVYLSSIRNPKCKAYTKRSNHEDLIEMEFEGHKFFVSRNYDDILRYAYSDDYMRYPRMSGRVAKHLPSSIDIGDLHKLEG